MAAESLSEAGETMALAQEEGEAGMFGLLDGVLLAVAVVVVILIVLRYRRKKKADNTQLRALQINPV